MSGVVLFRPVLAVVAAIITLLGLAGPADAAKPARQSVTITAPADGSTGTVTNVRVTGTAKGADTVRVTVTDDPNTYESPVTRGSWAVFTNPVMAGTNQICAEAFSAGISVARTCITYYVEPDGQALSLNPDGSYPVQSTFLASGGCDGNTTVRLTLDGSSILVPCTIVLLRAPLPGRARGRAHPHGRAAGPRRHHRGRVDHPHDHLAAHRRRDRGRSPARPTVPAATRPP